MTVLAGLTWRDAEDALSRGRLALVPVGSVEQHGPHLALDTDTAIADAFAHRLEADLGDLAVLCPPVNYGLSEHHLGFPGTVTLRPDSLTRLLLDLIESLAHWGLRRVLMVNGHGGNIDAIRLVARTARRDLNSLVSAVMWAQLAADEIARRVQSPSYGHACEVETSVAMVLVPGRVFPERIGEPGRRLSVDPLADAPLGRVDRPTWIHEWTGDGALGDPRLASLELGEAVVEVAHRRALDYARRFAGSPLPDSGPGDGDG